MLFDYYYYYYYNYYYYYYYMFHFTKGHNDKVWQAKWNSNGNLICSCGADKKVCLYSKSNDGQWHCEVLDDVHTRTVRSVAFSPDNNFIASSSFDSTTAIWMKSDNGNFKIYIINLILYYKWNRTFSFRFLNLFYIIRNSYIF